VTVSVIGSYLWNAFFVDDGSSLLRHETTSVYLSVVYTKHDAGKQYTFFIAGIQQQQNAGVLHIFSRIYLTLKM